MRQLAYCGMCADIIHVGHINIIRAAQALNCKVMIGLLTDEAICSYKLQPYMSYEHRKQILEHIRGVDEVVPQATLDYTTNLRLYRPKYVVHGDDWKTGVQLPARNAVIAALAEYGGELVEVPYTPNISSSIVKNTAAIQQWADTIPP